MRYASMRSMDITNGENIGVSLFVQGCPFRCYNCFNSVAWDFNGGKEWTDDTKNHFLKLIAKSYIKRVSILGGEPLASPNLDRILELLKQIRISYPTKTIWLYTGYTLEQILQPLLINTIPTEEEKKRIDIVKMVDVLVDGPYVDAQRDVTAKWRGSANQRVINIPKTLKQQKVVLYCD